MHAILLLLGVLFHIAGLICWLIILINAFQNEVWKGLLSLFCWVYMLYYAVVDFDAENKWLILLGGFAASAIGSILVAMAR